VLQKLVQAGATIATGADWIELDESGRAEGVRLDGPYADHESAEAQARRMQDTAK